MADFTAVLKKTIDALGDNTPEARQRVYQKARTTIETKLAALDPAPSAAVVDRQRKLLEDAIAKVEEDYAGVPASPSDDLEDVFAELTTAEPPRMAAPRPEPVLPEVAQVPESAEPASGIEADAAEDNADSERVAPASKSRKRGGSALTGIALLILLAGGAAAGWFYREDLARLANFEGQTESAASGSDPYDPSQPAGEGEAEERGGEAVPETPADPQLPAEGSTKFTQRLLPDGSEVDEGPAGGEPELGEGTSVAQATVAEEPVGDSDSDTAQEQAPANPDVSSDTALPVGQKAIFYEERTSVSEGSADTGGVVWSVVQESPGNDLPPEPAIRAEARIPAKNLEMRMTIRRNADASLPASHILEVLFLTPEEFGGGGIDSVQRVTMKRSEQERGSPLLGIPAKIADGFFLVALSDSRADVETNTLLLQRQSWIDIPIVYKSGRRALITIEKGIPGDKVFSDVLTAWQNASSG